MGVVAAEGGPTRWMDIGETRDHLLARVDWAPDSRAVAYQRLNRIQNRLDLGLADARTGASRVLLTEEDSYWVNVNDDFRFLNKGKQFLWGSERDGYHAPLPLLAGRQTRVADYQGRLGSDRRWRE